MPPPAPRYCSGENRCYDTRESCKRLHPKPTLSVHYTPGACNTVGDHMKEGKQMDLANFSMEQVANVMSMADHVSASLANLASALEPAPEPTTCTISKCTWG